MPDEEILKIVNEILNQTILNSYKFYLLVAAITFISAAAAFFLSSYFKQRGQALATKADFQQILEQLHQTTTVTERIRSSISSKILEEANYKSVLREKLELIFDETFKLELWLEQSRSKALDRELPETNASPISKIEMYQAIYFEKTKMELLILQKSYYPMVKFILDTAQNKSSGNEGSLEKFTSIQEPLLEALSNYRKKLLEVYAQNSGL